MEVFRCNYLETEVPEGEHILKGDLLLRQLLLRLALLGLLLLSIRSLGLLANSDLQLNALTLAEDG